MGRGRQKAKHTKVARELKYFSPETNYNDIFGEYSTVVCSANSRSRAQRVREMGWQPREKIIRDAFISEELPLLLEEKGVFHGYSKAVASGATG